MTGPEPSSRKARAAEERRQRLAAELRANLKKRKARQRGRRDAEPGESGAKPASE